MVDDLNLREQIARIDQMLADIEHKMADRRRMDAEIDRKRIEIELAPWGLIVSMATALAGFFVAGAALVKIFGG